MKKNIQHIINFTESKDEMDVLNQIFQHLNTNELLDVAIIGEQNSGKTHLLNLLSQTIVKPVSKGMKHTYPLRVTFQETPKMEEFECIHIEGVTQNAPFAFCEIPLKDAFNSNFDQCKPILEKMDVVIYVISALMPFTAVDTQILDYITQRFPVIIYLSKSDLINDRDELQEIEDYVQDYLQRFGKNLFMYCHNRMENVSLKIIEHLNQLNLEELRSFHMMMQEAMLYQTLNQKLQTMLEEVDNKKTQRMLEYRNAHKDADQKAIEWEDILITIQEYKQEIVKYIKTEFDCEKKCAQKHFIEKLNQTNQKQEWIENHFQNALEAWLDKVLFKIKPKIDDYSTKHITWLVSEVNQRFQMKIRIKELKTIIKKNNNQIDDLMKPDYTNALLAVGSGTIGLSSAILLPVPNLLIAIPTAVLALSFAKVSFEDKIKYEAYLKDYVCECCDQQLNQYAKEIINSITQYYEKLVYQMMKLSDDKKVIINEDYQDLEQKRMLIKQYMEELKI